MFPFKELLEQVFREDGNLPKKLIGGAAVGMGIGLSTMLHTIDEKPLSTGFGVLTTATTTVVAMAIVLVLSLRDSVRRRVENAEPVPRIVRLYLASGLVSLALWIATAFGLTFAAILALAFAAQ